MILVTLHWTQQPHKAYGAHTATHGKLGDVGLLVIAEGRHDGEKVHSEWYDDEVARRAGDPAAVAQELDIAYLSSGFPVFSPDWARWHLERVEQASMRTQPVVSNDLVEPVRHEERPDGEFWWFESMHLDTPFDTPTCTFSDRVICCGVDTSEGLGNQDSDPDYSAIVLWDPINGRPVGCFRSRIVSPADVAAIVSDLARRCTLLITIERNGPGLAVLSTLAGLLTGYRQEADVFYPRNYKTARGVGEREPGFRTTPESKHQLIELIRYHTDPERGTLLDRRLVDEYTVFAHLQGRRMGAPVGAHDDLVIALGLALVAAREAPLYESPREQAETDDAVMTGMAASILDGTMTDEEAFIELGLR